MRAWALAHPHEYALLYGTPVPGYRAPSDTVDPGTRVSRLLAAIVHAAGVAPAGPAPRLSRDLRVELQAVAEVAAPGMAVDSVFAVLVAWTQLFGMVSFEVFGQLRGLVEDHEALFDAAAEHAAVGLGL